MAKAPSKKNEDAPSEAVVVEAKAVNPLNEDVNLSKLPTETPKKEPVFVSSANQASLADANKRAYELMRADREKKAKLDKAIKDAVKSIVDKA